MTIFFHKWSIFVRQYISELAGVLGIIMEHETTKDAQTIWMLEKTHTWLKTALNIKTSESRSMWHKIVNNAVLSYNISYHKGVGCELSRVFHGRIPYQILDWNVGVRPQKHPYQTHRLRNMSLSKPKQSLKVSAKTQCKKRSFTTWTIYKKSLETKRMRTFCLYYRPKQITRDAKFFRQPLGELVLKGWPFHLFEKVLPKNKYFVR